MVKPDAGKPFAVRRDHQTNTATPQPTAMTVASVQRANETTASMLAVCPKSPERDLKSRAVPSADMMLAATLNPYAGAEAEHDRNVQTMPPPTIRMI